MKSFRTLTFVSLAALSFAGVTAACSDDDGTVVPGSPDAAADVSTDAPHVDHDSGPDAADAGPDSSDSGSDAPLPPAKVGFLAITQGHAGASFTTSVNARFTDNANVTSAGGITCTTSTVSGCALKECVSSGDAGAPADAGDAGDAATDNAGEIVFTGGMIADGGIAIAPPTYTNAVLTQGWDTTQGGTIAAKAAGATVPAFDEEVKAPGEIAVTAPVCAANKCGEIDRSKPLTVTWTGGALGVAHVTLSTTELTGPASSTVKKFASITCDFKASDGTGQVPVAALGKLLVVDGVDTSFRASFSSDVQNTTSFNAGDYTMKLSAIANGTRGSITTK